MLHYIATQGSAECLSAKHTNIAYIGNILNIADIVDIANVVRMLDDLGCENPPLISQLSVSPNLPPFPLYFPDNFLLFPPFPGHFPPLSPFPPPIPLFLLLLPHLLFLFFLPLIFLFTFIPLPPPPPPPRTIIVTINNTFGVGVAFESRFKVHLLTAFNTAALSSV